MQPTTRRDLAYAMMLCGAIKIVCVCVNFFATSRRTLEQMGGSWFIASANQRPTAQFHENLACRRSASQFHCDRGPLLASQPAVLDRLGPVHRVTKRPHQSAQLARAARFASERSVLPAFWTRPAGAGGPQFCSLICLKSPISERLPVVPWWWFGLRGKGRNSRSGS
jgi:hypothetical protein